MNFDELLDRCESPLEKDLLRALYPVLSEQHREELVTQYLMEDLPQITLPDLAFPEKKIAIYCDGYRWHNERKSFIRDRQQSRELQLRGWIVLRFAGREIREDMESVISTIQQALEMLSQTLPEDRIDVQRRIAILNDEFRHQIYLYAFGMLNQTSGRFIITKRIKALTTEQQIEICEQVKEFNNFTPDIDPDGEHDFGAIDISGIGEIFWKIDYYDNEQMEWGSEDPSNPAQTFRVLTIMFADEY